MGLDRIFSLISLGKAVPGKLKDSSDFFTSKVYRN